MFWWSSSAWGGGASDAELASHEADTSNIHGITDTSALLTTTHNTSASAHATTNIPNVGPSGALAETVDRRFGAVQDAANLADGEVNLQAIYLQAGMTVTNISVVSGSQAWVAGGGTKLKFFGLYSSALALLATSADDANNAWAANATKTLAMVTPYAVATSGLYYIAVLVNSGGGTPAYCMAIPSTAAYAEYTITPKLGGLSSTGQATLPSTAGAISATKPMFYAYVT